MCPFRLRGLQFRTLSDDSSLLIAETALIIPPQFLIDPHELAQRRVSAVLLQCTLLQGTTFLRPLISTFSHCEVSVLYLSFQSL